MFDRKHSLSWLVVLSTVSGALGQMLVLSAAPHPLPVRRVPHVVARRLAASVKAHAPASVLLPKAVVN